MQLARWIDMDLNLRINIDLAKSTNYIPMGFWDAMTDYYLSDFGIPFVKKPDGSTLGYSAYALIVDHATKGTWIASEWRLLESAEFLYIQDAYIEKLQAALVTADKINTLSLNANQVSAIGLYGVKIATMNEYGDGAYIQYYSSGRKRMEFGSGVITYYNDDSNNTVKWTLGSSGSIDHGSIDIWRDTYLVPTDADGSNVRKRNIVGDKYKVFVPGSSSPYASYSGLTVISSVSDASLPSSVSPSNYIPAGWYAIPGLALKNLDDPENTYRRKLRYYTNGKISSTKEIVFTINEDLPLIM